MLDLTNRVVVVTGAASGIGRATALAFLGHGAKVHAVDVNAAGLARLAGQGGRRAAGQGGGRAAGQDGSQALHTHEVDCRDSEAVRRLADRVFAEHGRVDVLHNNAGVVVCGRAETLDLAAWRHAIDINLLGVVHGLDAFLPRMVAQGGGGHIVNTASVSGLVGFPLCAPYSASKYAVVGLTEALDAELAPQGIRVSAICPGMVDTALMSTDHLDLPGKGRQMLAAAVKRFALSPEQVAAQVVDEVRRRRGGIRVMGLGIRPLWWLRRSSPAGLGAAFGMLSRLTLGRSGGAS